MAKATENTHYVQLQTQHSNTSNFVYSLLARDIMILTQLHTIYVTRIMNTGTVEAFFV